MRCPVCGTAPLSRRPQVDKTMNPLLGLFAVPAIIVGMAVVGQIVKFIRTRATNSVPPQLHETASHSFEWGAVPYIMALLVVPAVIGGPIIWLILGRGRRRTRALRQVADQLQFIYSQRPSRRLLDRLFPHALLQRGTGSTFRDVLQGRLGEREAIAGVLTVTYRRRWFSSSLSRPGRFPFRQEERVVLFFPDIEDRVPEFTLQPEGFMDRLFESLLGGDLDFTGTPAAEEFSRRYRLKGRDEARIREVFTPPVLELLADSKGWRITCSGGHLAFEPSLRVQSWWNFLTTGSAAVDPAFTVKSWSDAAVITRHLCGR